MHVDPSTMGLVPSCPYTNGDLIIAGFNTTAAGNGSVITYSVVPHGAARNVVLAGYSSVSNIMETFGYFALRALHTIVYQNALPNGVDVSAALFMGCGALLVAVILCYKCLSSPFKKSRKPYVALAREDHEGMF
jgi:hypothetical protein